MASRADELRRQADLIDQQEAVTADMEQALAAFRADPTDENKAAYRAAVDRLQGVRAVDRANRAGLSVVADQVQEG